MRIRNLKSIGKYAQEIEYQYSSTTKLNYHYDYRALFLCSNFYGSVTMTTINNVFIIYDMYGFLIEL